MSVTVVLAAALRSFLYAAVYGGIVYPVSNSLSTDTRRQSGGVAVQRRAGGKIEPLPPALVHVPVSVGVLLCVSKTVKLKLDYNLSIPPISSSELFMLCATLLGAVLIYLLLLTTRRWR